MKKTPFRNITAFFRNPKRVVSAAAVTLQTLHKKLSPIPEFPDGKVEIPMMVKSTIFPVPVVICGTIVKNRPNFNTLGNFGIISPLKPNPVVYISSHKKHFTNIGLRQNGYFSINIASRSIMEATDYFGVMTGHTTDKSNIMKVFYGRHESAPCLFDSPINYICKVISHQEIREMDLFIGEIVESFVTSRFQTPNGINIEQIEPLLYTADNTYHTLGAPIGRAYNSYKAFHPISI